MGRRAVRVAIAASISTLAAACGSTVSTASAPAGPGAGDQSLSVASVGSPSTGTGNGASAPAGTTSVAGLPVPGRASGGTAGSAGSGVPTAVPSGIATTSTGQLVVSLGVVYLKGLDQAYKAVGASSSSTDSQADYAAVIKRLNARPGTTVVLKPAYYAVDASSTQSQADQLEAACAYFTSDHHADLVVSYSAGAEGALASCLQKHGVPLVDGSPAASVGATIDRQIPELWQPSQLTLDRVGALEASYLVRNHWVDTRWDSAARCATTSQPRVGVVTFDRPDWRAAYAEAVAPTFKSAGHPVYDVEYLAVSGSTAEQLAQASSGAQNAVLKFSSECIDHVAFVGNVALDYLFMNVAQQQGYNPRYGLSSLEAPPVIVQNLPQPTAQLHGAIGPGWSPYSDVDIAQMDTTARATAAGCLSFLKDAGLEPSDNNSTILALPSCEGPMFAQTVFARWLHAGRTGTLLSLVDSLGSSYRPVGTYAALMTSRRHDGASEFRGFAYVDSCTCFRYLTGLQQI